MRARRQGINSISAGRIVLGAIAIVSTTPMMGCQSGSDNHQPLLCNPDFVTDDGECDEPWYSSSWHSTSRWIKSTARDYLSDFLGMDVRKELEEGIAATKTFQRAKGKIRALPDSFPDIPIGELMRTLRDPRNLDTLADFLRDGGPAAYELYTKAVEEGGPYLDQLETLLNDFAHAHRLEEKEIGRTITRAIKRYRGG